MLNADWSNNTSMECIFTELKLAVSSVVFGLLVIFTEILLPVVETPFNNELGINSNVFLDVPVGITMSLLILSPVSKHSMLMFNTEFWLLIELGAQLITELTFILEETTSIGTVALATRPLEWSPVLSEFPIPGKVTYPSVFVAAPKEGCMLSNPVELAGVIIDGKGEGLFCPNIENEACPLKASLSKPILPFILP